MAVARLRRFFLNCVDVLSVNHFGAARVLALGRLPVLFRFVALRFAALRLGHFSFFLRRRYVSRRTACCYRLPQQCSVQC